MEQAGHESSFYSGSFSVRTIPLNPKNSITDFKLAGAFRPQNIYRVFRIAAMRYRVVKF